MKDVTKKLSESLISANVTNVGMYINVDSSFELSSIGFNMILF